MSEAQKLTIEEVIVAVGVLMSMPGVKQEQYEQINKRLFGHYPFDSSDAPDGLLVHSAGPAPDGWYVYDIWETKDKFERFGRCNSAQQCATRSEPTSTNAGPTSTRSQISCQVERAC